MSEDIKLPPEIDQAVESQKDKELLKLVALGEDFERFIRSHLGRFLIERAERERATLTEQLVGISVFDQQGISTIQRRIWAIDSWQQWCAEAVREGVVAEKEFIDRNES